MSVSSSARRLAASLVVTAALLITSAGAASAHECYVANRSAQGDAAVGEHSAAWQVLTLEFVVTVFLGQSQEVADCVVAAAPEAGVPTQFVVGARQAAGTDYVIMESNPNKWLTSDGRGIDHAVDVYADDIFGLVIACGGGE